jgi:hypothetical protein
MTPAQRELARHALGLPNKQKRSYRNRYFARAGTETFLEWTLLEQAGFAISCASRSPLYRSFWLTRAGAEMALDPGESLDDEDFPK